MNLDPLFYLVLLIILTSLLYLFPFLPALYEWRKKTDDQAPQVNFLDRTIVEYQLRVFKEFIARHFTTLIEQYQNLDSLKEGKQNEEIEYIISGKKGLLSLSNTELSNKESNRVLVLCQQGILANDINYKNRIYSTNNVEIGSHAQINELYAEKNVVLNNGVKLSTLLYSGGTITIASHCDLKKYVKAKDKILFTNTAEFQYLHAPVIEFGQGKNTLPKECLDIISISMHRQVTQKKVVIPNNSHENCHFVVKNNMHIGQNCQIVGNIKCNGDMHVAENTLIQGAIFCKKNLYIGNRCTIQGPIICRGSIYIGQDCRIGTEDSMTTLVGEKIVVLRGSLVSGLILAKIQGLFSEK